MKLIKLELSRLAEIVTRALLDRYDLKTIYYPALDIHFDGERDFQKTKEICEKSTGLFYKVAGFY